MKITALAKFVSPETTKVVTVWTDYEVALQPRMLGADEETGHEGWQQGWKIVDSRDDTTLGWAVKGKEGFWEPYIAAGAYDRLHEDLGDRYERTGSYGPDPRHGESSAAKGEPVEWGETRDEAFQNILYTLSQRGTERLHSLGRVHLDDLMKELA